jgi:O-acetyl-ADP-ribose deacetylase (regulator of RNase III)
MPVIHLQGDLLTSNCNVIAHQANCFKIMGAGIAYQIKLKFPDAYLVDQNDPRRPKDRFGNFSFVEYPEKTPFLIFNLYGQFGIGSHTRQTNYSMLWTAMQGMKKKIDSYPESKTWKIGFPRLGTGLAGGRWEIIEKIIPSVFRDRDVHVYTL